ncbi:hypothetical protein BS639_17880 [Rouxiella silvae]|uniref:Uncharacterized protein n=1 Tax=Rouxiella silvae TaxID=1646373 RepID=A0ABX3TXA9_9GAMM|nr:hypothetical protein [Rouxiella silvae]ORJ19862.1 hypothetical protein BS639_17880 [Rouxiella silvae]
MALVGKYTFNGQEIAAAYVVIKAVEFKTQYTAIVSLAVYSSKEAYSIGMLPVSDFMMSFVYDGTSAPWDYFEKAALASDSFPGFIKEETVVIVQPVISSRSTALFPTLQGDTDDAATSSDSKTES